MAATEWPNNLRSVLRSTKQRNTDTSFISSGTELGIYSVERFTDDRSTRWTFNLGFSRYEAQVFEAWYKGSDYCDDGRNDFTIPIEDEFGLVDQTARFSGRPQLVQQQGNVFTYRCEIFTKTLDTNGENVDDIILDHEATKVVLYGSGDNGVTYGSGNNFAIYR